MSCSFSSCPLRSQVCALPPSWTPGSPGQQGVLWLQRGRQLSGQPSLTSERVLARLSLALPSTAKSFSTGASQSIPIGWLRGQNSELLLSQAALINGKCDVSMYFFQYTG